MGRRIGLIAILLLAAALRLWRLDQNGFGNEYYAAGVRTMSASWHNFLYHAFDPAGFLSVDKPPGAMWIQVASVKLLGFHGLVILLPQVLEGLAAVWLLYHLVRRRFGGPAGLLAALFLAVTPVSVAVDRSGNTESCLVLLLLLAAWALTKAAEEGRRRSLLLALALVSLAFNVKMLAAFVVLPTFALVYLLGAPGRLRRRLADGAIGGLVLAAVSLSWVAAYDLTPPHRRPYAGTTDTNAVRELVVGPSTPSGDSSGKRADRRPTRLESILGGPRPPGRPPMRGAARGRGHDGDHGGSSSRPRPDRFGSPTASSRARPGPLRQAFRIRSPRLRLRLAKPTRPVGGTAREDAPPAAGSLGPRLPRNLAQYNGQTDPLPAGGAPRRP
jgi:hypothetical protein